MASPQLENGHTNIAHELLEALIRTPLSDYEHRVFWCIVRKTYGWNKKMDWISNSQISDMTDIKSPHVSRTLKKLIERKMIIKDGKMFGINKNYDMWILTQKLPIQVNNICKQNNTKVTHIGKNETGNIKEKLPIEVTGVTYRGKNLLPIEVNTKEKKETTTKYMEIFIHWNNKNIIVHNKLTNDMIKEMKKALKTFTLEEILGAIDHYSKALKDDDFYFTYRWSLLNFLKRKHGLADFMDDGEKWINYQDRCGNKKEPKYRILNEVNR